MELPVTFNPGRIVLGVSLGLLTYCAKPVTAGTVVYYLHNDHLGTPRVVTDHRRDVKWRADYRPFGETIFHVEDIEMPLRMPGQYFDRESGLHYNYYRDYDPTLGRYIQSDPIGLEGGLNTYNYVGANPLSHVDPLGLWSLSVEGYFFAGGGISIAHSSGTLEVLGRLGVGFGVGATYDPLGTPSPHSEPCGNGYIATTSLKAGASFGIKPFAAGGNYTASTGNAVVSPQGGGFQSFSPSILSPNTLPKLGVGIGVSVGSNIGSYTNW